MIRLRLLGHLDIIGLADNDARAALLAQRKRLALLLYILLGSAGGAVERHTLLALFWPEMEEERARQALRRALHFLRRALGPGVLVGRGRHAVEVDTVQLECDVLQLRESVVRGRPMEILECYRGELLPGFHVGGLPAYDRWLDAERSRVRSAAYDAAMALAREALGGRQLQAALSWSQRAESIAPAREEAVRLSIAVLHELGSGAAAVRKYEALEEALGVEFDMAPSAETRRLIEAVKSGQPRPTPEPATAQPPWRGGEANHGLLAMLPGAVVQADLRGRVRYANAAAAALFTSTVTELRGGRLLDLVRDDYRERVQEVLTTQLLDRTDITYAEFPLAGQEDRWVGARTRLLGQEAAGAGGTLSLITDITERKRVERAQRRGASRDPLTGLPDRSGFELILEDRLRQAMRTGDEVTLFHVSLGEEGKGVDSLCTSDHCQLQAARLLRGTFRDADVVARIDEGTFAAVAVAAAGDVEGPVRARLERRWQAMREAGEWPAGVSLDVGVVRRSAHSRRLTELLAGNGPVALMDEPLWEVLRQSARTVVPPGVTKKS